MTNTHRTPAPLIHQATRKPLTTEEVDESVALIERTAGFGDLIARGSTTRVPGQLWERLAERAA
ncbi:hypothetical protein SEA_HONK_49 [Microbacterium phage Honk]|uniref:Uncharacterized protein n=1 Tax=Microbacterium phage Honk TaxID=2836095 RepID=A0A8F3E6W9_9CAUD|nr:hypothetical protein SEA_HONK_49 [Microbacterium phage Honk]